MSAKHDNPYTALKQIFHEPSRLAIISALCGAVDGLTFNELKEHCELTDGNLSRHLKALEEASAVRIEKSFVGAKPRTTVFLTDQGRESFLEYLQALEGVLRKAAQSVRLAEKYSSLPLPWIKPVRA